MRVIFIIGSPSGGTSCTAGSLALNGYYMEEIGGYYESFGLVTIVKGMRRMAYCSEEIDLRRFGRWLDKQKKDAQAQLYEKLVVKVPGVGIYHPELINEFGMDPLIVTRDPAEIYRSASNRFFNMDVYDPYEQQEKLQQIKLDHPDWPSWDFSKNATHEDLEVAVGHELPFRYFDPDRVTSVTGEKG